ncbi:MAG: hypothetical protein COY68_00915, partial [Candidatus Levybacteria bacterium CG_4_10_14_0_8_um_filter_35_23]
MINFSSEQMSTFLVSFALGLTLSASIILSLTALGYLVIIWYRHRDREKNSIDSTLLQVLLPRDNEIKIDAA